MVEIEVRVCVGSFDLYTLQVQGSAAELAAVVTVCTLHNVVCMQVLLYCMGFSATAVSVSLQLAYCILHVHASDTLLGALLVCLCLGVVYVFDVCCSYHRCVVPVQFPCSLLGSVMWG